jgi:16S rRNA (cytosine1402-N4)-methyltransferase
MESAEQHLKYHTPVLAREILDLLELKSGDHCVDATLGDGGHTSLLLNATAPNGRVLGIDADIEGLNRARSRLSSFGKRVQIANDNFTNMGKLVNEYNFHPISAILFDLGLSSYQLDQASRGFSFRDNNLDMRLQSNQVLQAADIVNSYSEKDLEQLLITYGEEPHARRITRTIIRHRPISSAWELAQVIERAVPRRGRRTHPATKSFQAIRIRVNNDLKNLETSLYEAMNTLKQGGRLAVIAYHSLEDRMVKLFYRKESQDCVCPSEQLECICEHKAKLHVLNKKIVRPTDEEIELNPRSRSARLRVAMTLGLEGSFNYGYSNPC